MYTGSPDRSVDRPEESNFLDEMIENKLREIRYRFNPTVLTFPEIFSGEKPVIIAEIKANSPWDGILFEGKSIPLLRKFEKGGAGAISVVTDEKYFGGGPALFSAIRKKTRLQMLWKDLVLNPRQFFEAAERGADAILLIASVVNRKQLGLRSMLDLAESLDLTPIVEVYNESELEIAVAAEAQLIAVNSRNLYTGEVNMEQSLELVSQIPKDRIALLFSGIKTRDDVLKAHQAGAKGVLVGTALLRADDPVQKLRELSQSQV